ncbi:DUF3015 family protein [Pseudobdellovibrio exovorus]|uniref:Orotate phosphoribosyltransferase n=1 Tax=Pseudobdellovibrio exovorus JSS TaxID=1184267 RepID=M4VAV3_9BACT|nr:DUF3015 family protein [Pseudobdellovibrio exovorus]AGH96502.1 hypothetical protein A11Q_2286 [Pseudobdellovibrio exovorus JSS]
MLKALLITLLAGSVSYAGDAGCGLGGQVIKSNTKLAQLGATFLNGLSANQTFGISSGTSGCTASGLVQNEKQIQYFVEVNQADLTREMAQGHGAKMSTLAALNGCATEQQVAAFNAKAQASFKTIVPSAQTTAVDFVNNMKSSAIADVCQGS